MAGFRPLAGFWFLNYLFDVLVESDSHGFPSPCGVLVLKFMLIVEGQPIVRDGFRPLAGFWFLN